MKIEEGKYYRTRDGRKVGPMVLCYKHEKTYYRWFEGEPTPYGRWSDSGEDGFALHGGDSDDDLIAEWVDDEPGTPKRWKDLTPEEKGALLLAHHEGKVIEVRAKDSDNWHKRDSPNWAEEGIFRVKPEPVRKTVTLYGAGWHYEQAEIPRDDDTHRITFDLVDGEPDTDSIKMEKL